MNQEQAELLITPAEELREKCYKLSQENRGALMGTDAWLQYALCEQDIQLEARAEGIGCYGSTFTTQTQSQESFDFTIPYSLL